MSSVPWPWQECYTDNGGVYYWNSKTQETVSCFPLLTVTLKKIPMAFLGLGVANRETIPQIQLLERYPWSKIGWVKLGNGKKCIPLTPNQYTSFKC
jgi:hypothetical protein